MSLNDILADSIARIRNAIAANLGKVELICSKKILAVLSLLREEGYVGAFEIIELRPNVKKIVLELLYSDEDVSVIKELKIVSKPGCRLYSNKNISKVCDGLGVMVVSTSRGIMSDSKARGLGLGGELLCKVL